eukprot:9388944-Pyramimonas_sp.AAC.1
MSVGGFKCEDTDLTVPLFLGPRRCYRVRTQSPHSYVLQYVNGIRYICVTAKNSLITPGFGSYLRLKPSFLSPNFHAKRVYQIPFAWFLAQDKGHSTYRKGRHLHVT